MNKLRTISAITGWVLSYTLLLGVVGAEMGTCTMGDDDRWKVGLILFAPTTIISFLLLYFGLSSSKISKWFSIPHILTLLLSAIIIPKFLWRSTVLGWHLCGAWHHDYIGAFEPTPFWHRIWAIVFIILVINMSYIIFKYWKKPNAINA